MKSILIFWFFIFNIIVLSAQTPNKIKIKGSFQDEALSLVMVNLNTMKGSSKIFGLQLPSKKHHWTML